MELNAVSESCPANSVELIQPGTDLFGEIHFAIVSQLLYKIEIYKIQ